MQFFIEVLLLFFRNTYFMIPLFLHRFTLTFNFADVKPVFDMLNESILECFNFFIRDRNLGWSWSSWHKLLLIYNSFLYLIFLHSRLIFQCHLLLFSCQFLLFINLLIPFPLYLFGFLLFFLWFNFLYFLD